MKVGFSGLLLEVAQPFTLSRFFLFACSFFHYKFNVRLLSLRRKKYYIVARERLRASNSFLILIERDWSTLRRRDPG